VAIAALAFAALVVGIAVGAGSGGGSKTSQSSPKGAPKRLGLDEQVGQLLISSFDGTELPDYMRHRLQDGQTAGVILFGGNVQEPDQLTALTKSIQSAAGRSALVGTDQEGGPLRNVDFAGPAKAQPQMSSSAEVRSLYTKAGKELRRLGINVDFAPVADVSNGSTSILQGRVFRGGYGQVVADVQAAVRALRSAGVGATVKHFPGLGAALDSTDDKPVAIGGTRDQLEGPLIPFREAVKAKVPLVMASHAFYPGLDKRHPASQSPEILGTLLRKGMKFRGAIVTDSIEARGVLRYSSVEVAAERSIAAGADLVLMTGSGSWKRVYPHLLKKAQSSPAFRRKVVKAAQRVLQLKRKLGLRPPP
jgi:beta-N-acetylhexosaminidase